MMRSMFSGVSGLKVHQTKMDVIGNNISNVNTIGYKAQRVTFNEVFSQTLQGASAASDDTGRGGRNAMQVGLGVNVSSIDMLMTQGATERTDNPFDLMINGSGFIVVGDASGQYFTRNGALRVDENGNLCLSNGMKVQGWNATKNDEDKYEIVKGEVQSISLGAVSTSNPEMTTKATLQGNINAVLEDGKAEETSVSFYDSLGNYYKAVVNLTKTVNADTSVTYTPTIGKITDAAGNELKMKTDGDIKFTDASKLIFDNNGKLTADSAKDLKLEFGNQKDYMLVDKDGKETPFIGKLTGELSIDCKDLTQYTSKSTLKSEAIDGNSAGTMSGYSIGPDGIITASYTNGATRMVGQVIVAEFDNPTGLEKTGDNLFAATVNSGEFDGIGTTGNFNTGCLEMSNVDLSNEFTQMITTQRGFQANSRIITVSDEMLQELTNLKR